jgi:hypothetical protein
MLMATLVAERSITASCELAKTFWAANHGTKEKRWTMDETVRESRRAARSKEGV